MSYWCFVLALWGMVAAGGTLAYVASTLPPIQALEVPQASAEHGDRRARRPPLAKRGDMGGADVPIKDLPPYLPKAFIAIEDRRFYSHFGIDPIGLARAVVAQCLHRGVSQGGSTLTQQLAKNLFLTQERTL